MMVHTEWMLRFFTIFYYYFFENSERKKTHIYKHSRRASYHFFTFAHGTISKMCVHADEKKSRCGVDGPPWAHSVCVSALFRESHSYFSSLIKPTQAIYLYTSGVSNDDCIRISHYHYCDTSAPTVNKKQFPSHGNSLIYSEIMNAVVPANQREIYFLVHFSVVSLGKVRRAVEAILNDRKTSLLTLMRCCGLRFDDFTIQPTLS